MRECSSWAVITSQSRIGPVSPADARIRLSGENAIAQHPHSIPEQAALCAGFRVPKRDRAILVCAGERATIRGKLDRRELLRSREDARDSGVGDIPQAYRTIARRGG